MPNLEYIDERYKPYRYTIKNHVTVIDTSLGKYIIKKEENDVYTLFNYLDSRGFNHHPIINYHLEKDNIYEYTEEEYLPIEIKLEELAKIVASLHNKTVYYKEISLDNIKEIKEIIMENIIYTKQYYDGLFLNICQKEFQSPSEYLFARNYYHLKNMLHFAEDNLGIWYEKVNKKQIRVSIIHNNLSLDHFIYNTNNSIIISWDKYQIDTPLLDIIHLFKKEYLKSDFTSFFKTYFNHFELLKEEKDLLFIILNIPFIIDFEEQNELKKTQIVHNLIEYLHKVNELTRVYYLKEEEKK